MFQKILVALDYSDRSRQALHEAIQLAHHTSAKILLLHVISTLDHGYPIHAHSPIADIGGYVDAEIYTDALVRYAQQRQNFEREQAQLLQYFVREVEAQGGQAEWRMLYGDAGRAICQTAEDWQADLIILGRRGRSSLKEAVLGSVSNYVMHHATCNVLVVQPPAWSPSGVAEQQATLVF
jgi:nucleotide-binding universal stress UspA family protein